MRTAREFEELEQSHSDLMGALRFILAFYEPGQTYLDTNAWKHAEAGARAKMVKADKVYTALARTAPVIS